MPLRSPKMYTFIFGFHRRVWWPKWTPASRSSFIEMSTPNVPPVLRGRLRSLAHLRRARDEHPVAGFLAGREFVPAEPEQWSCHYRLLYWKRLRAPFCPYFLRSFMRESRVRKPFLRSPARSSGLKRESARESPMRSAPDWPPTPPPFTVAMTSTEFVVSVNFIGSTARLRQLTLRKYSSAVRPLMEIFPEPNVRNTRATDSLRRPVP